MEAKKNIVLTLIMVLCLLFAGCGVSRASLEQQQAACEQDKAVLLGRIASLEKEKVQLAAQLKEKETQFTALFMRFESISDQLMKLKKENAIVPEL